DVMVSFSSGSGIGESEQAKGLSGIEVSSYGSESTVSKFDLSFSFMEGGSDLYVSIEYDTHLFSSERIDRMLGHLNKLLGSASVNMEQPLYQLSYLTEAEEQQLESFNDTFVPRSSATVIDLFEQSVQEHPDAVAISYEGDKLSYRQLNEQVNQLSHYIRSNYDLEQGGLVGVMLERSPSMIVAILGILKSGASYVPIDPEYPAERVSFILKDSAPRLLITDSTSYEHSRPACEEVLILDEAGETLKAQSLLNPEEHSEEKDLAYVIYTSGTTGQPKGVMIDHRALYDYVGTFSSYFSLSGSDVVLQQSSLSFDTAVEEIFPALCASSTLLILKDGGRNIESIIDAITHQEVSVISTTPAVLDELNQELETYGSLRVIISGGDELKRSHIDRLIEQVPVYNTYGPTESTVCVTYGEVSQKHIHNIPIGRPIANRQVYILNERMQKCGVGELGELYIGGSGLAQGYLNQPELTAERFIANPYGEGRLYKTGDIGKWRSDGSVEFSGRRDHQVKIRGYRIELGEIEHALQGIEGIKESVVDVYEEEGQKNLVAYIVGGNNDQQVIREYLHGHLPQYMVPAYYVFLDSLPLTSNGKLDRKALPSPDGSQYLQAYVAPVTAMEQSLAKIWEEVLNRDQIGTTTNFFDLGGHSLKATRVVSQVYKQLGLQVSLREVFLHPTVGELSKVLEEKEQEGYESISRVADQPYYEISHAQRRLWVLDQFEAEKAYNIPSGYVLDGDLDVEALEQALESVIARHESLRTRFISVEGEPKQEVVPVEDFGFSLEQVDLRGYEDRNERAHAAV
ncbi:amino acid adenylation domain-containing protein, partial [Fulvivirga kasyanovii]|uniref:non-ribosomal peptide synthetase n=1 Tax=Fulvivirga kasyanovii TaxID=396812 RepID=UPI0031DF2F23